MMQMMVQAQQVPEVRGVFSSFEVSTPQVIADIDRSKAEILGVPVSSVFDALAVNIGSTYVNDFTLAGRTYRVTAQAEYDQRLSATDVGQLLVRNRAGDMVPLASLATFSETTGPYRTPRHNLYPCRRAAG